MKTEKTFLYTLARGIAAFLNPCVFLAKARGVENFPREENCIILSNHLSAWDPITIAHVYKHNEIHFIAKESLFRNRALKWFLGRLHAFPVSRGEADLAAMRTAVKVIADGDVLGIFPEGHRRHTPGWEPGKLETGVAVMALRSRVPVVPVFIAGKYRIFGKIRVVVGTPLDMDDLRARRPDAQTLEEVKHRILDSWEALQRQADW